MFDARKKAPIKSLIVVIPANHSIAPERIAERVPASETEQVEVIVACAGQPADLATIHTQLRSAQFLLAPAGTSADDLRALALAQVSGDIVSLLSGVPLTPEFRADRRTPPGQRVVVERVNLPLSIIVPVRDGGALLDETLAAIVASGLRRETYELIVVDDASDDDSLNVAARYADTLVRLTDFPRGAAYARNRGAEIARGALLAFVNADVRVARDTFARLVARLEADPSLGAVGTANDGSSGSNAVAAQYWNLVQRFGAERFGGRGIHFTASCGMVRRTAFTSVGGFNEWVFRRASLEGLDLGDRLARAGHGVLLDREIGVSHLRHHDVRSVLRTSWNHSSALVRSVGYRRSRSAGHSHRMHALGSPAGFVAAAVMLVGIVAAIASRRMWVVPVAAVPGVLALLASASLQRYLVRVRGVGFAVTVAPLHLMAQIAGAAGFCAGWVLRNVIGQPAPDATTQAFSEVGVTMWPPVPRKQ